MSLKIAMIREVYPTADDLEKLHGRLAEAREQGARLAVLPELSLDPWYPAERQTHAEHAEAPGGRRSRILAQAAKQAGIAVLGSLIVDDEKSGERRHRALLHDAAGALIASYDKCHTPSEEGFWESDHYGLGDDPPRRIDDLGVPIGIQLCSDVFRPAGSQMLAAAGAAAILAPRATEGATQEKWGRMLRANAITCCAYVLSVGRPREEFGVGFGGPAFAFDPTGETLVETEETVSVVEIDPERIKEAKRHYPGYLAVRPELYAAGWQAAADSSD